MSGLFEGLVPYEGYEDARVEKRDGVVVLTLNVPEKLNALTPGIRFSLKRICEEVRADDSAKVLVLTGEGRGFCSGADVGGGAKAAKKGRVQITENSFAWIKSNKVEKKMIKTMKKGSRIMVTGYNKSGSQTIDHYSLLGITKA